MKKILNLSANPGGYVLDSFLGSGTTAAVSHKIGRRYIGVEMGEQTKTHCAARLKKVIEGEAGGISEAVGREVWGEGGARWERRQKPYRTDKRKNQDINEYA